MCAREKAARGKVRLVFTVSDSGIGLTAAEIKRLFRPFAQANERVARRYGGAGLGLAFVKRLARAMGGDLAVASAPGGGSRFRFSVTADKVAEPAAATPSEATAAGGAPVRALTVLCAEDNPYGRVLLNTILSELGHRADFVGTGAAAVEAVAHGRYDVVLMDVTLPDIDGIEATRRIRARERRWRAGADRRRLRPRQRRGRDRRPRRRDGRLSDQAVEPQRAHAGARLGRVLGRPAQHRGIATLRFARRSARCPP